jgi:hypothetical protein
VPKDDDLQLLQLLELLRARARNTFALDEAGVWVAVR